MTPRSLLPSAFFRRPCVVVARDLVGRYLRRDEVVLRITETEAYCGPTDTACHARSGRTERNAALWGQPGTAYVYVCYGLHQMLNLVAGERGGGCAVLIRAAEIVDGEEVVRARRGGRTGPELLTGPGKVAAALAVDRGLCFHDVTEAGGLELRAGEAAGDILVGPRVGIDSAAPADVAAPWRFAAAHTAWVTRRASLRPAVTIGAPSWDGQGGQG